MIGGLNRIFCSKSSNLCLCLLCIGTTDFITRHNIRIFGTFSINFIIDDEKFASEHFGNGWLPTEWLIVSWSGKYLKRNADENLFPPSNILRMDLRVIIFWDRLVQVQVERVFQKMQFFPERTNYKANHWGIFVSSFLLLVVFHINTIGIDIVQIGLDKIKISMKFSSLFNSLCSRHHLNDPLPRWDRPLDKLSY